MSCRVVFDCNVYVQAMISPSGPAGGCVDAVIAGRCRVFISEYILSEVRDVAARPQLAKKFRLNPARVERFLEKVLTVAQQVDSAPHVFHYQRDPRDEQYIDLAVATQSQLVVSRDKDLLILSDPESPEGLDFLQRFPSLRVVAPVDFLSQISEQ